MDHSMSLSVLLSIGILLQGSSAHELITFRRLYNPAPMSFKNANGPGIPMSYGSAFAINATVGTPPQNVSLFFDLSKSHTVIPIVTPADCGPIPMECDVPGLFNPSNSSTLKDVDSGYYGPYPFDVLIEHGNDEADGFMFTDNMRFGNFSLSDVQMAGVPKVFPAGYIGLGSSSCESTRLGPCVYSYPNLLDAMKDQGKIKHRGYSLWLDQGTSPQGRLLFGAVDRSKFIGKLEDVPLVSSSRAWERDSDKEPVKQIAVHLQAVGFHRHAGNLTTSWNETVNGSTAITMLAMNGDTILPDRIVNRLYQSLGFNESDTIKCDTQFKNASVIFDFVGHRGMFEMNPSSLLIPDPSSDDANDCILGVTALSDAGTTYLSMGDTFLQSNYIAFDLEDKKLRIAQAASDVDPQRYDIVGLDYKGNGKPLHSAASGHVSSPLILSIAMALSTAFL